MTRKPIAMPMIKRSISLTEQQANWVKSQIDSGNYGNESEVFRDLIRDRVAREAEICTIRAALIEGEQSGMSNLSAEDIWAEARRRHFKQNA
jgi:antitoxin ParD1/3/4